MDPASGSASADAAHESIAVRLMRLPHGLDLPLPEYQTPGSAGMDVRAAVLEAVEILPGAIARVPTGLAIEVPAGFEVQIRPRSGLAMRHGITLPNSPATIDSDYRGEIVIGLVNLGTAGFRIERGMRIAQLVLARAPRIVWRETEVLTPTARGPGGFGHTGVG